MVVTRGSDQTPITSAFSARGDKSVIINYGALLIEVAKTVPDGIVCFFTSYEYLENVVAEWHQLQILNRVLDHKLLFIETKDIVETTLALDNFRRACDCGRGAIFLSIARGKVSEGIDFDRHYGRAVLLFGIPFQYTKSHILLARLEYLRVRFQIREEDYLSFDALRQAAQCIGRVIRSKADYGIMIFADKRYNNANKRSKLPPWVTQFLKESNLNLSTVSRVLLLFSLPCAAG
jgi:DNA excision repair protein ERCC-2